MRRDKLSNNERMRLGLHPYVRPGMTDDETIDDRNRDIRRRRAQGETLRSIGEIYDLSHERVRQIDHAHD
jgi:DNA-directed RNA polymerase sigma subunit (sigma70/sigma32)